MTVLLLSGHLSGQTEKTAKISLSIADLRDLFGTAEIPSANKQNLRVLKPEF
jgi:hypothetical protein